MNERLRVAFLIIIMTAVAIGATGISLLTLYNAAFNEQSQRLTDAAQSQARTMEAMARFNARSNLIETGENLFQATIEEIADANQRFEGFGKTGEFTLAKKEQQEIVFLLKRRHRMQQPASVSFASQLAEPMRKALSGASGTIVGLDYRGKKVLAAYEPVAILGLGLVAKIDLDEIRAPFIRAALFAGTGALAFVLLGSGFFWQLTNPLLRSIRNNEIKYRSIFENSPNAIFLITDIVEDCNEQACRLWANTREELIGHPPPLLAPQPQEHEQESIQRFEASQSGKPQSFYWQHQRKDGALIDTEIFLKAIEVEGSKPVLAILRDITERRKADEALRVSEERFRSVFEFAVVGMAIASLEGKYLEVNKAFCRFLGITEGEILQQQVLNFTHPADRERTRRSLAQLLSGQRPFIEYEKRYLRKDDAVVWGYTTVSLVHDANNKPLYFVGLVEDITDRKQAEDALKESEALLSVIYNESTQFMGLTTPDGTLLKINRTAADFIQTDISQILNKPFWETPWWTHSPEGQELLKDGIRRAAQGEFVRFETTHQAPEGNLVYVDFSLKPVKNETGKVVLLVPEGRDITERKQAEREIRQLNQELETRVIERTRELELANQEMEAFTYSVSQDLRAPLRAIDGFSEALLEDHTDKLDEEGKSYLRYLQEGSRDMSALIDGLLTLSRLTRGDMAREPVDLSSLVTTVVKELRQADPKRQVSVQIAKNVTAAADYRLLKVVMENLLGNSWKYTGKVTESYIEFGSSQQDGEAVYYVRDNGAGFDMNYADKLFMPFHRLHKTGEFSGTGIGLATVQRIIHRHGGEIWAESAIGEGATFFFTLSPKKSHPG